MRYGVCVVVLAAAMHVAHGAEPASRPTNLPFTISRETTLITEPLHADGTPDYLGAVNATDGKGIRPEENGFVTIVRARGLGFFYSESEQEKAAKLLGIAPVHDTKEWDTWDNFKQCEGAAIQDSFSLEDATHAPWVASKHPTVAAYLQARSDELRVLENASRQPHWWIPGIAPANKPPPYAQAGFDEERSAIEARVMMAIGENAAPACKADILTMRRMARKFASGAWSQELLAAARWERDSSRLISIAAGCRVLSKVDCEIFGSAIVQDPLEVDATKVVRQSRYMGLNVVSQYSKGDNKRTRTGVVQGGVPTSVMDTIAWDELDCDIVLKTINLFHDEILFQLKVENVRDRLRRVMDLHQLLERWREEWHRHNGGSLQRDPGEDRNAYAVRVGKALLAAFDDDISGKLEYIEKSRLYSTGSIIVLAAARFNAAEGQWPEKLESLVPKYLASVPRDPFGEGAFRYRDAGMTRIVYSVGLNGEDDGGVHDKLKKDDMVIVAIPK